MPALALALVAAAPHQPPRAYELVGRSEDGTAERIAWRDGRWVDTLTAGPGVVQRTVAERDRVVRYGVFGDVEVADPGTVSAWRYRIGLLTGTLPPPTAAETMRGPKGTPVRYEHYHRPRGSALEVTREHGEITEATLDGWFAMRDLTRDAAGVVVGWRTVSGDGFHGVRSAAPPPPFAEPEAASVEDGDPAAAELDGTPIKVFIDTGWTGFAVSEQLAAHGTPVARPTRVMGLAGTEAASLVRFATFTQLGVTRIGQVAVVAPALPEGYDAIEGIGMFPGRSLHAGPEHTMRVDRRGCASGLRFTNWDGVARAVVGVSRAPMPFLGWGVFDTGLLSERPMQIAYPPLIAAAVKRERFTKDEIVGVGGTTIARCTTHPVTFGLGALGSVAHPLCYIGDASAMSRGAGVHSALVVNPVAFLGGPVTIDGARKLICRDR